MGNNNRHKVVVVGGGFGGLWATRSLRRADVDITLIDKRNFHLFQPLLYQVATGALSPADIASPIRGILAKQKNVTVQLGEMTGANLGDQYIIVDDMHVPYDSLIIATGSQNHYFGNDNWSRFAPGLKTIEDALTIRSNLFVSFEKAERETNPEKRKQLMTFVIIGGGPTGVELAGALGEIARITLRDNFRTIDPRESSIFLVEGADDILLMYDKKLRDSARRSLEKLGVEVITGALARDLDEKGVAIKRDDDEFIIETTNIIWAAGVKPSPIGRLLAGEDNLINNGQVKVNENLSLPDYPDVYVIGDLAYVAGKDNKPLPGNAPVAMSQGKYVAKKIRSDLKNEPIRPFKYRDKGTMAVIGRATAIANLGRINLSGYPAWLLWVFVHLMYLVEFDNRLVVFIQWAWNYFTRNRGARLITNDGTYTANN